MTRDFTTFLTPAENAACTTLGIDINDQWEDRLLRIVQDAFAQGQAPVVALVFQAYTIDPTQTAKAIDSLTQTLAQIIPVEVAPQ